MDNCLRDQFITDARFGDLEGVIDKIRSVNINAQSSYSDGDTALIVAAQGGYFDIVSVLVEAGAVVDGKNVRNETALLKAARFGQLRCAKYLVDHGADVNIEDQDKRSPLIWACHENRLEMADYLLSKNADIRHKDVNGFDALTFAAYDGHASMVKLLLDKGAPSSRDFSGNSALYNAIFRNNHQVVKVFMERDIVDMASRGHGQYTPLELAIKHNCKDVAGLIMAFFEQQRLDRHLSSELGKDTGIDF